ncbi:MAG: electron transport complex subunit RsxG [Methylophilaceae bacterium]|nr:electron transport complex subunit RsxG [Methylophilaceae bacterium]MBL6726524.1 electron transport complex subunit RsxG [Methylophilaceae bacterium]MBL6728188.1 electron transport complex subunit RsxG [Methylophilaceae bacterium]MBL6791284.1 electron transport complex subunit RsxG [Methylophilaceae bacterium]
MSKFLSHQKIIFQTVFIMTLFGLIFSAFLGYFFETTSPIIQKSEAEAKRKLLLELVSNEVYDNDIEKDFIEIESNILLKNKKPTQLYLVKNNNMNKAVILEVRAPDGYSGDIFLLVAINKNAEIINTRVIKHQETPGLGDYIDKEKTNWIDIFQSKSFKTTHEKKWAVKKDQGEFDYMTGATITPRAVIKALYNALKYFEENKKMLGFNDV